MKKTFMLFAAALLLSCRSSLAVGWWEEPWTASEKPYAEARKAVDRVRGNQKALSSLVNKWRPQTQRKIFDQVARYRWGYALYWLTRTRVGEENAKAYKEYGLIREGLRQSTFDDSVGARMRNRSYEFNRLRFWVEQRSGFPLPWLGERLLRRSPDDAETQMAMLNIRLDDCPPEKKASAIALWRKVATRYRNGPITTYWLARIYHAAYRSDYRKYGDPADARKANELFLRFLKQAPNTLRYQRMRTLAAMFAQSNQRVLARSIKATS